jgi:holo-[acyl-carrier protein] synthase
MKILGIGVDIVENKRIQTLIKNQLFIKRIFSKKEILLSKKIKDKTAFFSKRFAAKEAFSKSLGTGIRNDLNFIDISIVNNKLGKPYFLLNTKIKQIVLRKFKIKSFDFFLSISDEKKYSIAFTILQTK